jgi:hypothetical protein
MTTSANNVQRNTLSALASGVNNVSFYIAMFYTYCYGIVLVDNLFSYMLGYSDKKKMRKSGRKRSVRK